MKKTGRFAKIVLMLGTLALFGGGASKAHAAMYECSSIGWVDFAPDWSGVLTVGCQTNNTNFYAYINNGSSCRNVTLENLKIWKSTAELALLSGKKLQIYYTSCGGVNRIDAISIRK